MVAVLPAVVVVVVLSYSRHRRAVQALPLPAPSFCTNSPQLRRSLRVRVVRHPSRQTIQEKNNPNKQMTNTFRKCHKI